MLERLPRVGKKILATGNGRCNLTNLHARSHGYTNREIADKLFLCVKTIEAHRSKIYTKLKLKSRAELVDYAIAHKLMQL